MYSCSVCRTPAGLLSMGEELPVPAVLPPVAGLHLPGSGPCGHQHLLSGPLPLRRYHSAGKSCSRGLNVITKVPCVHVCVHCYRAMGTARNLSQCHLLFPPPSVYGALLMHKTINQD